MTGLTCMLTLQCDLGEVGHAESPYTTSLITNYPAMCTRGLGSITFIHVDPQNQVHC